ncbi:MAG: GNAT family N-acetyltransferase [Alphaproteobacteria bacterium]
MSKAAVIPLDPASAQSLSALHGAIFERAWSDDEFTSLLSRRGVTAWGVTQRRWFRARELAGFILMKVTEDEAEVLTIAVRQQARGRGLGRLLMEEALRALYSERVKACFLEVDASNVSALGLYRSLGFQQVGERKGDNAGGSGALVMRLQLG